MPPKFLAVFSLALVVTACDTVRPPTSPAVTTSTSLRRAGEHAD